MRRHLSLGGFVVLLLAGVVRADAREVLAVREHATARDLARIRAEAARDGNAYEVSADSETIVVWRGAQQPPSRAIQSGCTSLSTTPFWSSTDDFAVGGLRWLDVDDDGQLDLVSAHYEGGFPARPQETRVWLNVGGTLETTASWMSADAVWSTDVAVGDIDRNGFPDLAIVNSSTNTIHFHDGTSLETTPSWASASTNWSLAGCLGRIDANPFPDLAVANQTDEPNILYGNTTGVPSAAVTWSSSDAGENTACALGDYDEDGLTTVVVPMSGTGTRSAFRIPIVPIHRVVEVTVAGAPVADVAVHLRDGWAVFQTPPAAGSDNIEFTLEVSDDLDLAVSVRQANAKVYHDVGATLETSAGFSVSGPGTQREKGVAWVDVDGDGDLDLFVGGDDVPMQLFRNDAGTLEATAFWASADAGPDVADIDWVDIDNDGDPDLATANTTTTPVFRVYENVGGTLDTVECWGVPWGGSMAQAVAWGDIDGDGWPDLAVAHAGAPIHVYRNQPQLRLQKIADNVSPAPSDTVQFTLRVTDVAGLGLTGCILIDDVDGTGCMTLADTTGCVSSAPVDPTFACASGVASAGPFGVPAGGTQEYVIEVTATAAGDCTNTVDLICDEGTAAADETLVIGSVPDCNLLAANVDRGPPRSPALGTVYVSTCNGLGGPDAYTAIADPGDPDELTPPAFDGLILYQLGCDCAGAGIYLYEKDDVLPGNIGVDPF